MKITIDTKEDSHEEIKKVIKMLSSLVGEETFTNQGNIFENKSPDIGNQNMFSMFDDKNQTKSPEQTEETKKEEVNIDIPGVEEYN